MLNRLKRTKAACTSEDARFLLLLCLGREPYLPAELETYTDQSFFGALKRILKSAAFSHSLFDPFVLGKKPMQVVFSTEQSAIVQNGLSLHFRSKQRLEAGDQWLKILSAALTTDRLQKAFLSAQGEQGADRLQFLQTQLKRSSSTSAPHVFGAVHQTAGRTVRGFAAMDGSQTPLILDFFLDGQPAGTATADQIDREASEKHLISVDVAFNHTLEISSREGLADACLLMFERDSGAMVCPPKNLVLDVRAAAQTMARTVHELDQLQSAHEDGDNSLVSQQLTRLQERLPSLEQYCSLRLEDYSLYRDIYRTRKPQNTDALNLSVLVTIGKGDPAATARTRHSLDQQSYQYFTVIEETAPHDVSGFDLLVSLNAGDMLDQHALAWFASSAERNPSAMIMRAGYNHYSADGNLPDPVFISEFDPLILAQKRDYACAFATRTRSIDANLLSGSPELLWDKIFAQHGTDAFVTINEILLSVPPSRDNLNIKPLELPEPDMSGKLAIIIPTKDRLDILKPCVESLLRTITAKNPTEIIIVDNASNDPATIEWLSLIQTQYSSSVRVISYDAPFNWADINNKAVASSDANYLLFLNNDTEAIQDGWDLTLRQLLAMDGVGVIGAKLLYNNDTVQHAGVVLNDNSLAIHEGAGLPATASGYDGRLMLTRQCEAVTGAFLACSRKTFQLVGGFDAENFPVTFNDIDFCLKVTAADQRVIYSPLITFYHLESVSRGYDGASPEKATRAKAEHDRLRNKWALHINSDRWYPAGLKAAGNLGDVMIKPPSVDRP